MEIDHLPLKPENCSNIGVLVAKYMAENQLSFTEMAQHVGVSHAVLPICCNRHGKAG